MNLIAKLLPPANVVVGLEASSKKRAFEQAGLLFENNHGIGRSTVFDSLFAREKLGSTGLGQGIAIPHGRIKGLKDALGAFIRLAKETGAIPLYGGGTPRRTFTHVQDVCAQIAATALRPETEGQTYNVAGEAFALAEVAGWIAARLNARVVSAPWPEKERAIESGDTVFDDAKIRALLPAPLAFRLRDWIAAADFAG